MDHDHKPYFMLFNAVTDAIEQLEAQKYSLACLTLERAQKTAELAYLDQDDAI